MKKNVKMADIAEQLHVSNVTVSKALANKEGVSEELRAKIKTLASEMGYHYNTSAKSLKDGLTYNIGVTVAERFINPNRSFYWEMYQNILDILKDYNYYGIIEIIKSDAEEKLILPSFVGNNKVDGLIVLGPLSTEYLHMLSEQRMPMVLLDFYGEDIGLTTILSDNFYGAYLATNFLFRNGHTKIGFVGTLSATSSIQDRFLGYYKSLMEHGVEKRADWIIDDRAKGDLFTEFLLPREMPTAFVCNCDEIAFSFINFLTEKGYSVPEDISIVGFDNYIFATLCKPQLTTINVDMRRMANAAVTALFHKVKNPNHAPERLLVSGSLIRRDSVKNIKPNQREIGNS